MEVASGFAPFAFFAVHLFPVSLFLTDGMTRAFLLGRLGALSLSKRQPVQMTARLSSFREFQRGFRSENFT